MTNFVKGYEEGHKAYIQGYKDALEQADEFVQESLNAAFRTGEYERNQASIDLAAAIQTTLRSIKEEL